MKKTLAAILCAVMVLSCCCVLFASADTAVNLAKGRKVSGAEVNGENGKYVTDLTDEAVTEDFEGWGYDGFFAFYWKQENLENAEEAAKAKEYNKEKSNTTGGVGMPVIDLGEVCTVESASLHAFTGNSSGIMCPAKVEAEYSLDGKTYTAIGVKDFGTEAPAQGSKAEWLDFKLSKAVSARYIRLKITSWAAQNGTSAPWTFIDEIKVMGTKGAAPVEPSQDTSSDTSSEPTVVTKMETVKLDGKLDDDAWTRLANGKWFTKALWQNIEETDPQPTSTKASYAVRSDAENIYIALTINEAWAYGDDSYQTGATNFRIWMLGDGDYEEEANRTFFDVTLNAEGGLNLWYNAGADVRKESGEGKISAAADTKAKTIAVEFAVKKSAVKATNSVKMMITYSSPVIAEEGKDAKYNALHITAVERDAEGKLPAGWSANASLYTEYKFADTALVEYTVSDEPAPVDPVAEYTAAIAEKLGEAVADSAMNVTLSNVVAEDGTITVTLTIDGLKDGAQVDVLEGALYYDAEKLTLTTNLEDLVLTTSPDSDWETLTAPAGEGKLDFSAFTTKAKTLLNKDGKLTMDLTFTLKDGCTYGAVWMENGVSGEETDLETGAAKNTYKANGGYTVINTTPVVEPSEDSSSATSSTTPKPGDAGIVVFALLGLVAVAGAAVVIKVRH